MLGDCAGEKDYGYGGNQCGDMLYILQRFVRVNVDKFGNQEYIYKNYGKPNFVWTDESLQLLEFLSEKVKVTEVGRGARSYTVTSSDLKVYHFSFLQGGSGDLIKNYKGDTAQTTRNASNAADGPIQFIFDEKYGDGMYITARRIIGWVNDIKARNGDVSAKVSRTLSNLGFTKNDFYQEVFSNANLLVKGDIIVTKRNPKYEALVNQGIDANNARRYSDPTYQYSHKVKSSVWDNKFDSIDIESNGNAALPIWAWATSDPYTWLFGDNPTPEILLANYGIVESSNELAGALTWNEVSWFHWNSGTGKVKWSIDNEPASSVGGAAGAAAASIAGNQVMRLSHIGYTSQQNVKHKKLNSSHEFSTDGIEAAEKVKFVANLQKLITEVSKKQADKVTGGYWRPQKMGIPPNITDTIQLQNFFKKTKDRSISTTG
jgi:hypothetical protein